MVGPARVMEVMATLPARESRRVAEAMELVSRMMVGEEDHD